MPRKSRMYLPGIPSHVVQRGNDRNPCFFEYVALVLDNREHLCLIRIDRNDSHGLFCGFFSLYRYLVLNTLRLQGIF